MYQTPQVAKHCQEGRDTVKPVGSSGTLLMVHNVRRRFTNHPHLSTPFEAFCDLSTGSSRPQSSKGYQHVRVFKGSDVNRGMF